MKKILVRHTSILINEYDLGECPNMEAMFTIWDSVNYKLIPFYSYDEDARLLRLPRGANINILEKLLNRPVELDKESDPFTKASFKLNTIPRNTIQKKAISFILGEGEFKYTKTKSQLSLNLDTGDGKTYSVIAAMTFIGETTMIVTHIDKIKMQWMESLKKFTSLTESHICNIDSSSKIDKLMKAKENKYKVYMVNHRAIFSYAKKNGWGAICELFTKLNIGLKVYDEAHFEFANILKIDSYTNTKKNIYVTASFNKTGKDLQRIFKNSFANVVRYGMETRLEKERHIVYMPIIFNTRPSDVSKLFIKGIKGFDRNRYSDYQLEKGTMLEICDDLILRFTKKNDTKILVLFSKIDAVEEYKKTLKQLLPDKNIIAIHSKVSNEERESIDTADIIISTPKSSGTGVDIDNLGCVIMTEPYSSSITGEQTAGRLRYLGDDKESYYIELVDRGFEKVYDMYTKRIKVFKKKCKKIILTDETKKKLIQPISLR